MTCLNYFFGKNLLPPPKSPSRIYSRLHANYREDANGVLPAHEIFAHFKADHCTSKANDSIIGRYINRAFKNIKKYRKRAENNYTKLINVYQGLVKVTACEDLCISFTQLESHIPKDYHLIEKTDRFVRLSKQTNQMCNGHIVSFTLHLSAEGHIRIYIANTEIDLSKLGISENIDITSKSLRQLFCSLQSMKLCSGFQKPVKSYELPSFPEEINEKHQTILRPAGCKRIVPFNSLRSTLSCNTCRSIEMNIISEPLDTHTYTGNTGKNTADQETENSNPPSSAYSSNDLKKHIFWTNQKENANLDNPRSRRYPDCILQLCLSMWNRSPRAYEQLTKTGYLILPSTRLLSSLKNSVNQNPGINSDVLKWMFMEAKQRNLAAAGYYGGLVLDEMTIQEDLQMKRNKEDTKLIGLVDLGDENENIENSKPQLANHVLQYVFHGLTGFRFPVAHYPTRQANAVSLYTTFWDVVASLHTFGFHTIYSSMDGASTNRSFLKFHFPSSPIDHHMSAENPYHSLGLVFIMDPSHLFKKIRNNILKSGQAEFHTRLLLHNKHQITWDKWIHCAEWNSSHSLPINHKLTNEHIFPNQSEKMRNHLAEEVLDKDMLYLMKRYRQVLGKDGSSLDGCIELLQHTSPLIDIFRDIRPVHSTSDLRLTQLKMIDTWFRNWSKNASSEKMIMSKETCEDLHFLISGFCELVRVVATEIKCSIVPGFVNSDIVENNFSQQRGIHHGATTNPNYLQYCYATNSIILGQNIISNKSNASKHKITTQGASIPFKQLCRQYHV